MRTRPEETRYNPGHGSPWEKSSSPGEQDFTAVRDDKESISRSLQELRKTGASRRFDAGVRSVNGGAGSAPFAL